MMSDLAEDHQDGETASVGPSNPAYNSQDWDDATINQSIYHKTKREDRTFGPHASERGPVRADDRFESRWEVGDSDVWNEDGPAKSIILCTPLSAAVKWSSSQTWTSEPSTVFRRDITKREIIMGIKLEARVDHQLN